MPGIIILTKYIILFVTTFHSDGCVRTGTFITISYTLERMKVEGIVDIFHAAKSSRINRPGLVGNVVSG